MARPQGTKTQRKLQQEQEREKHIQDALRAISNGELNQKQAAQRYGIAKQTLSNRKHGRKPRRQAHATQQALSPEEEDELIQWLREMDSWGLHLRMVLICARAEAIRKGRGNTTPLGKRWWTHFTRRHPELTTALGQRQDLSRARAEKDPVRIDGFYDNVCDYYSDLACILLTSRSFNLLMMNLESSSGTCTTATRKASC